MLTEPLPRGLAPRGLTKEQAAAYCGCLTTRTFDAWVRDGLMPAAMPGTVRWDRKAIDLALDRLSGLRPADNDNEADRALSAWEAGRNVTDPARYPG